MKYKITGKQALHHFPVVLGCMETEDATRVLKEAEQKYYKLICFELIEE